MNKTIEWKKTQPGSTEAVQFSDGMLVTAKDLTAAMHYPLAVVQVLIKAFFGCGIVCGLDLRDPVAGDDGETDGQRRQASAVDKIPRKREPNFILTVEKGVALGCDGYPIEICGPIKLDLTPDPCRLDRGAREMFVAVRRVTAAEAAAGPCGCGPAGGDAVQQCTRMRDHALLQAFDEEHLPAELCRLAAPPASESAEGTQQERIAKERPTGAAAICGCLKQCGECACCGDPWVLLGSLLVGEQGLGRIDRTGRRYVKPIACVCDTVDQIATPIRTEKTMDDVIADTKRTGDTVPK